MDRVIMKYGIILLVLLVGNACYDDLGNYDYQEINELTIVLPEVMEVAVPMEDSVEVVITPEVRQLSRADNENLKYLWRKKEGAASLTWAAYNEGKDLHLWIKSRATEPLSFRFAVTDTVLGITSYKEIVLKMLNPLENAWFVLQEQEGKTVLGAVDGSGPGALVKPDIYRELLGAGKVITGEPRALTVIPNLQPGKVETMTVVDLLTSEGGMMMDSRTLETIYDYREMLLGLKGAANPQYVKADRGELVIDNGKMWFAAWSEYSVFYPVKLDESIGTDYELTQAMILLSDQVIAYDRLHQCFLWYNRWDNPSTLYGEAIRNGGLQYYDVEGSRNRARLKLVGNIPEHPNQFDPDQLNGRKVLFMGVHSFAGIGASQKGMAIACGEGSRQLDLYEFSNDGLYTGDRPRCSAYYKFVPSMGDENSWQFATSCFYNNVFFYASGNEVFRVDLNSFVPLETKIYEYPDPAARIVKMKFRHERFAQMSLNWGSMNVVTEDQPYWLGLAVEHADGKASIVEMRLKPSGEVLKEDGIAKIYEYSGFEGIVDISYSFHLNK